MRILKVLSCVEPKYLLSVTRPTNIVRNILPILYVNALALKGCQIEQSITGLLLLGKQKMRRKPFMLFRVDVGILPS
jgi:hypothetical protein